MRTSKAGVVILLIASVICFAVSIIAEVPKVISLQGRLTDTDGNPLADGDYEVTFQIVEHDPVPLGESPLWSSGPQTVTVTDGLFNYYLGSHVPLPAEVFNDDGLDSYFVRMLVEGSALFLDGIELVTTPFAIRSLYSDTAAYALAGPGGSGDNGWVDDGSVVHTQTGSDKVGIGTTTPTDMLVVGGNLGTSVDDTYIVVRNNNETYCGFKLGYNSDNYGWLRWYSYDGFIKFGTRQLGANYLNTLVLNSGNVGIGQTSPNEKLVVGDDLGSFSGNRIVVGDHSPAGYTGLMMGEDSDNRAFLTWSIDGNYFDVGIEDEGTQWSQMIKLEDGEVSVGVGSGDASVQLPNDAIGSAEILDEPGVARVALGGPIDLPVNVWATVCSKVCDFPDNGYALVLVTCDMVGGACRYNLEMGIARNGTSAPRTYSRVFPQNFDYLDLTCHHVWEEVLNLHELFSVNAGTNTFNFMANSHDEYTVDIHDVSMTVVFFPTQYAGATAAESAVVPDETAHPIPYTPDNASARNESRAGASSDRTSIDTKLNALEEENAELRRRLEALEEAIGK